MVGAGRMGGGDGALFAQTPLENALPRGLRLSLRACPGTPSRAAHVADRCEKEGGKRDVLSLVILFTFYSSLVVLLILCKFSRFSYFFI